MLRPLLSAFATVPLLAQTVHTVGGGGFAQIQDAILAAAPGDVIEVQTGNYHPFVLDKALTIRAVAGARVVVLPFMNQPTRIRPPVGTVAAIARIEFLNPWIFLAAPTRVERGTTWFEDCVFESPRLFGHGGLAVDHAAVALRGCLLAGFGIGSTTIGDANPGLLADGADVLAADCICIGSYAVSDSLSGGAGVLAYDSSLHFVRCEVYGGDHLPPLAFLPPGPGIETAGACRLWLADCFVEGGTSYSGIAGAGVVHGGTVPLQLARTTILGGPGLNQGTPGPAIVGPSQPAPLLGLDVDPTPIVRGSAFALAFRTEPNWPVAVVLATGLGPLAVPELAQPAGVLPATSSLLALQLADPTGAAPFQTAIPPGPALLGARLFVAAVAGASLPLQTSPPVGGLVW
ncbi:MAG: hypothetical protein KDE27_16195 [Planctomycetes bacterium]|nr:hypothetical protein [Planctomycetota bacterium]